MTVKFIAVMWLGTGEIQTARLGQEYQGIADNSDLNYQTCF
jgi:hypothetical protein